LTKDEIKPGDHITVSGTVIKIDDYYGHIIFVTTSGLELFVNSLDIQTHKPMKEDFTDYPGMPGQFDNMTGSMNL
jgi:hypothetical protein